jgi:putative Mg2+ transporter-C (MgtC) family protein
MFAYNSFDPNFWVGVVYTLLCGFIIGVERQVRGKPVGIRTSILICLGTMLFIHLGVWVNGGSDSPRILGQIITGIGFLGAGVIMNKEGLVSGVTSASVVWLLAGIGTAIGFHFYTGAVIISFIALGVLVGVQYLEDIFKNLQHGVHQRRKGE